MECIACHSEEIIRYGYYKTFRKYKCKNCHRQFSERSFSFFTRYRFPEEIIKAAILLFMFVSTRNVKFLIAETYGFYFSHVTAYNWSRKFASLLSSKVRKQDFSSIWHVDEKFIKVKSIKQGYEWVVIDDRNSIIATYVSDSRDIKSAIIALELAVQRAIKPPDILVSDGCPAYIKSARKVFGRKVKHIKAHFKAEGFMHKGRLHYLSNNRIEGLNSKINLWYKKFRGFKSLETANLWCNMWMYFYNFMRPRIVRNEVISINQILV